MKDKGIGRQFTTEQLLKIIGEGSYDLGYHDGLCEVLERLKRSADICRRDGSPWELNEGYVEKWAEEEFDIDLKK